MIDFSIYILLKIKRIILKKPSFKGAYAYRKYLFEEVVDHYGKDKFKNSRILEIGPKDGEDTVRILSLKPKELILFDLPDKAETIQNWNQLLRPEDKLFMRNFMYLNDDEFQNIGKFDLIYFTGVLYHNPEQLRFLNKLYEKLNTGGVLVLETATVRNIFLRNFNIVQIWYPNTYRDTSTISHLPSKKSVVSWLNQVGFSKINISNCYDKENYNVRSNRHAIFAEKKESDSKKVYYKKQIENSDFIIGGSS